MTTLNNFSGWLVSALTQTARWQFNCALLIIATCAYSFLCFHVFHGVPRLDDSVAALYQARVFASGHLIWPMPNDLQPWFDIFGIISPLDKPDHWAGMYTPGWPLLLAIGVLFGTPWIVNPILGGLLCIVIAEIAADHFGRLVGRVAGILALVSPYIGVVSASYLSHTAAALFVALAWWSTSQLLTTKRGFWSVWAGASIGIAILIRPEAALFVGLIIAIGTLCQWHKAMAVWKQLILAAGIALAFVAMLLAWQDYAVGEAGYFGHRVDMGSHATLGFGLVGDSDVAHTPELALLHSQKRLTAIHQQILGWPIPALVLMLAPLLLVRPQRHRLLLLVWLLAPLAALTTFFYFYWYYEEWLPGRYLYPAVPFLVVLMAHGWHLWQQHLASFKSLRSLPALLLVAGSVFAVVYSAPQYHRFFKPHHGDVEDWLPRYIDHYDINNALILYRSHGELIYDDWNDFFATGVIANDLDLQGNVVVARDERVNFPRPTGEGAEAFRIEEQAMLLEQYPDRNYYYYEFDQLTGRAQMHKLTVENHVIVEKQPLPEPDFVIASSLDSK